MENLDKLLKAVRSLEYDDARNHLVNHINTLAETLVSNAWKRSQVLLRFARKNKKQQMKKYLLEMDEHSSAIPLVEFVKYVASIQDVIEDGQNQCSGVEELAELIEDNLFLKLKNIKVDKRTIIFKKD